MKAPCFLSLAVLCGLLGTDRASATEPKHTASACFAEASGESSRGLDSARPTEAEGLPDAPGYGTATASVRSHSAEPVSRKPFSTVAIGFKAGLEGVGIEISTPLGRRFNLRGGINYLAYNPNFNYDGLQVTGDINFRSAFGTLDIFPFNNGLRISAGAAYNGSLLNAKVLIPGGQYYSLGDGDSTLSSQSDPVHGTFGIDFGRKLAPRLTVGTGNMIPRRGGHWSFPIEIGFEYLGRQPRATLYLEGTACQAQGCGQVQTDPTAQMNILQEEAEINADIPAALRFFPVVSTGISFRFGRDRKE